MNNKKIRILVLMLLCAVLLVSAACADTGPKPSVSVRFINLGDEPCYATLLSKYESTGPHHVWEGSEETAEYAENMDYASFSYDVWKAFVDYEDDDGFYFLQEGWQINASKEFTWGYYPPDVFTLLLYFPDSGTFAVSDIYETYAFESAYAVDMKDFALTPGSPDTGEITLSESYEYGSEILGLIGRIVVTLAVELGIALLFGYRAKKQLWFIAWVNLATQTILNVLVNTVNYHEGALTAMLLLIFGEFVVFVLEAVIYGICLGKRGEQHYSAGRAVLYALTANLVSFAVGRLPIFFG